MELVPLPSRKFVVGCRWIFAIKVGSDGTIDRLKARFVARGDSQIFGLDLHFSNGKDDLCSFIHSHDCSSMMTSVITYRPWRRYGEFWWWFS